MRHRLWVAASLAVTVFGTLHFHLVEAKNQDVFNYGYTDIPLDGREGTDYGQSHWGFVACDDKRECPGFPEKFPHADLPPGMSFVDKNFCRWCEDEGDDSDKCGLHRQSPINLKREVGFGASENAKECIDWHFIKYEAGSCDWNEFKEHFTIERHALRISVPQRSNGEVDCEKDGERTFPRADYSKGFPNWWWLDHLDITVPSNHVQEGKRYDAEVVLAHFYQQNHEKNQLGYMSVFLDAYDNAESWPFLDKLICQWRIEEEKVRDECGLDPAPDYGRCRLFRGQMPSQKWLAAAGLGTAGVNLNTATDSIPSSTTNLGPILRKTKDEEIEDDSDIPEGAKVMYIQGKRKLLRKENFKPTNETDQDWFERVYANFQSRQAQAQSIAEIDYEDESFWEYEFLVKVGTEYYFRYEGTQLVPPCWDVVHWRVFKDPIPVPSHQIDELNRLLAWRVAPSGSKECSSDTAGVLNNNGNSVSVARDLQYEHLQHRNTFCECKDWPSKFEGDQKWCDGWRLENGYRRFYETPYNFDSDGNF